MQLAYQLLHFFSPVVITEVMVRSYPSFTYFIIKLIIVNY